MSQSSASERDAGGSKKFRFRAEVRAPLPLSPDSYEASGIALSGHGPELMAEVSATLCGLGTKAPLASVTQGSSGRRRTIEFFPVGNGAFLRPAAAIPWDLMKRSAASLGLRLEVSNQQSESLSLLKSESHNDVEPSEGLGLLLFPHPGAFEWVRANAWRFGWNEPVWSRTAPGICCIEFIGVAVTSIRRS